MLRKVLPFTVLLSLLATSLLPRITPAAMPDFGSILEGSVRAAAALPVAPGESLFFAGIGTSYTSPGYLVRSADGGETWSTVLDHAAHSFSAVPGSPGTLYAATDGGLFRTADYGDSWELLHPGIRASVTVNPVYPDVIYGNNLRSLDGGVTWSPMAGLPTYFMPYSEAPHIRVAAGRPEFLYALVDDDLYRSTNGGESWENFDYLAHSNGEAVEVDPTGDSVWGGACGAHLTRIVIDPAGAIVNIQEYITDGHTHGLAVDTDTNRVFAAAHSLFHGPRSGERICRTGFRTPAPTEGRMMYDSNTGRILIPNLYGGGLLVFTPSLFTDDDCDGFSAEGIAGAADCDDSDDSVYPGAREIINDGIDQDCNGSDQTITVTVAKYLEKSKTLEVVALDPLGPAAALVLTGYGPMSWNPVYEEWNIDVRHLHERPLTVEVCSPEGCVTKFVTLEDPK